jgi:mannose-6-phosphate isomerase-like protein (cupin superfamily)
MKYHLTTEEAAAQLTKEKNAVFTVLLQYGTMQVEYFAPKDVDRQTPHKQDEIYVIVSGQSRFFRNGEYLQCKKNDVLFVPAGMEHRFEDFTNDFATWVIFYGREDGEASK